MMNKKMSEEQKAARRAAREAVFILLYETEYHDGETPDAILARAVSERELDAEDKYLTGTYLGVMARLEEIDAVIGSHATGWKTQRLSRVSRAVLRLAVYEMMFAAKPTPAPVAINEAVELAKRYDDDRARPFINGVLNAVKNDMNAAKAAPAEEQPVGDAAPAEEQPTGDAPADADHE